MRRAYYMVATASTLRELTAIVETVMQQGWELAGGVCVFGFPGNHEYFQALSYREAEPPPPERGGGT